MESITLLPADTYTVVNKTILSLEDRKNLISLYEPIMGATAVALYLTLWNDLDKLEISSLDLTHHRLMSLMKLDLDNIKKAREALEAVGLLRTFYKEGSVNSYIYELYSPLSPKEFLNHPVFNVVLYNNIGKNEYLHVKSLYDKVNFDTSSYEEITKALNETYKSTDFTIKDIKDKEKNIPLAKDVIDFDLLVSSIPKGLFNDKLTKKTKDLINNLAFVYSLDTLKMAEIIRTSITELGTIDITTLRLNARNYYTYENLGKLPTLIYRTQPEYLKTPQGDSSNRAKLIYVFENTTPYDFLRSKYHGATPTKRDLRLLEYLTCDLELKPAVVNVLVDYVLKKNDNKLNQAFVETIAGQWKRANIETVPEAISYAKKQDHKVAKKTSNVKNPEAVPSWFNKEIKEEEASSEEVLELEELLKGYE